MIHARWNDWLFYCFVLSFLPLFCSFYGFGLCHQVSRSTSLKFNRRKKSETCPTVSFGNFYCGVVWGENELTTHFACLISFLNFKFHFGLFCFDFFWFKWTGQRIGWWGRCGFVGCGQQEPVTCRSRTFVLFARRSRRSNGTAADGTGRRDPHDNDDDTLRSSSIDSRQQQPAVV